MQSVSRQSPVASAAVRRASELGVRGRIAEEFALVASGGDHDAVAVHDDRADRHVARRGRLLGLGEGEVHPLAVDRQLHAHSPSAMTPQLESSLCESTLPITRSSPTS